MLSLLIIWLVLLMALGGWRGLGNRDWQSVSTFTVLIVVLSFALALSW